jgi:hypothetical protein
MIYYRIASETSCECAEQDRPKLVWERIRKGYAAIQKQYGTSDLLMNNYAFLAVQFKDAVKAQEMFTAIGDRADLAVWGTENYLQQSKLWASQTADSMIAQQYDSKTAAEFRSKYSEAVAGCASAAGLDPAHISLFLQLGQKGAVERVTAAPAIRDCLADKLQTAVLAAPPRPHYGIPITMQPESQ